jgi:hypothetical protein
MLIAIGNSQLACRKGIELLKEYALIFMTGGFIYSVATLVLLLHITLQEIDKSKIAISQWPHCFSSYMPLYYFHQSKASSDDA